MFQAMFSPIIRSIALQLELLVMSADVAAGWCRVLGGTGLIQTAATLADNCGWSGMLLMMGENIAQNM
jgi:hypothetical protein